jgi:hypothetical protein
MALQPVQIKPPAEFCRRLATAWRSSKVQIKPLAELRHRFATAYRFRFENTIWLVTFVAVTSTINTSDAVQAI